MAQKLTVLSDSDSPDLKKMPRADGLAIWQDFQSQLDGLTDTAKTLTVTDASQTDQIALARTTRLSLRQIRIEIERKRVELGEEALRRKQTIDRDAKKLRDFIEPLEARLLEQERFIEIEDTRKREQLTAARRTLLTPFEVDCSLYDLGKMPEETFSRLLASSQAAKEERQAAAIEALRLRTKQLDDEKRAREAQAAENERLRIEAEQERQRTREAEAALQAERNKETERLRLERETERKRLEAEREAEEQRIEEARRAANAPDKEKLLAFADRVLELGLPEMQSDEAGAIAVLINKNRIKLAEFIRDKAETL